MLDSDYVVVSTFGYRLSIWGSLCLLDVAWTMLSFQVGRTSWLQWILPSEATRFRWLRFMRPTAFERSAPSFVSLGPRVTISSVRLERYP